MVGIVGLVEKILAVNPTAMLSGTLALNLQGIKTLREPSDIDIFVPFGETFTKPDGTTANTDSPSGGEEDEFTRTRITVDKIAVDIFISNEEEFPSLPSVMRNGIKCVRYDEIIKFKVAHYFTGKSASRYKHKDDVIGILVANSKTIDELQKAEETAE